jgi:SAM-dependent methyltransferase
MNYCNPEGFRNEIKALLKKGDIDAFYHWFDGGETKAGAFEKGADVFHRVIYPYAKKYLKGRLREGDVTALDLGYGAGTKILTALNFFQKVYGVDVHDEWEFILQSIAVPEGKEVILLTGDGHTIPVGPSEIDFLYSWITFCHVGTIENVESYLGEIYRVLQPGGIAVLFFTRLMRSGKSQTWKEVEADIEMEKATEGFREGGPESKVRSINLVMAMWKMDELASRFGFNILDKTASWDDTPSGRVFHGQYGIVIHKPIPESPSSTVGGGGSTGVSSGPSESTSSTPKKEKTLKKTLAQEKKLKKKPALKKRSK